MIGEKKFDCHEMFTHACAFCECADLCTKVIMDNVKSDIDLPELVNSAFACEVFLKTILKWYDIKSPKSHKLKDLYASTPDSIQAFIKATVLKNYDDIWTDEWGVEHLESLSNAFQDFRYFYEYDFRKNGGLHIETGFLIALRDALRDCCCRVIFGIGWEEYKGLKPIGSEK